MAILGLKSQCIVICGGGGGKGRFVWSYFAAMSFF